MLWAFREFAFDYQKIANLTYGWRVRVRCPSCGNIVDAVMLAYTVIHGCDPDKYQAGEIVEILPPDPKASSQSRTSHVPPRRRLRDFALALLVQCSITKFLPLLILN